MIELTILSGLTIGVLILVIFYLLKIGHEERQELEDRLMALSKPEALITHKAMTEPEPGIVDYVDEAREYGLIEQNGHPDLLGDN